MKGIQEYSRNYSPISSDETEERPHLRKAVRTGRTQNFNKDKFLANPVSLRQVILTSNFNKSIIKFLSLHGSKFYKV